MNVVLVMQEIVIITNSMIGESALPDFSLSAKNLSEGMRVSALDELNGMLEGYVRGGSEQ